MKTTFPTEAANIGPCLDVKAYGGRLYAIQRQNEAHRGRLVSLSPALEVLDIYDGIGCARQIEIKDDVAVVAAREDGLWIFDLSGDRPKLLSHYLTVEFATGVSIYGSVAFASCRQYGVEAVDISDPQNPRHIGMIRVGEVQSTMASEGVLYCGCWGEMKISCVDISDISAPKVISEIPINGRGDGVCVKDGVLYAATGQHRRGIVNVVDKNDPCFGAGNGVELFDVRDPAKPSLIKRVEFDKAYHPSVDMWEAAIYGDLLIVNDSVLGIYLIGTDDCEIKSRILPSKEGDAVTGVTSAKGDLFFTTAENDLYAVRGLSVPDQYQNTEKVNFRGKKQSFCFSGEGAEAEICHSGEFPVLAADISGSALILACAESGIRILDKNDLSLKAVIPTADLAVDVRARDKRFFVAEGFGGVEIFELSGFEGRKIGGFTENEPVNQLAVSESGDHLICGLAENTLKTYDVRDAAAAVELYRYKTKKGNLYGGNFPSGTLPDGRMIAFCHRDGLLSTDPDGGSPEFKGVEYLRRKGFCGYCAGDGIEVVNGKILYTLDGGYVSLSPEHKDPTVIDDLPLYLADKPFKGLLSHCDGVLVAADRTNGRIFVIDVSNMSSPRLLADIETSSAPAKPVFANGRILIPAGRSGLIEVKINR